MDSWLNILFEMGVLLFFGLLYYVFAKRRIIHHDTSEIFFKLDKTIVELHEYLDGKEQEPTYEKLNNWVLRLEKSLESKSLIEIIELFEAVPPGLPEKTEQDVSELKLQIDFHKD